MTLEKIRVVDSHTGGEPTRIVVEGGPDLGSGPLTQRLSRFRDSFDCIRSAIVNEPRGSDAIVGALLCQPGAPSCVAGVIFFNNVGYLGMCGHGTIGLAVTLAYLGRIGPGRHMLDTPVGVVTFELHPDGSVSVDNVPSYRSQTNVQVDVPGYGKVIGDVAWGGNWFFLTADRPTDLQLGNLDLLVDYTWRIRQALKSNGITGDNGMEIDHIEVFGPPTLAEADSKNFVLCPGKSYDRSPCGTGTSAKLACLQADGQLKEGEVWRQESLIGSLFEGSFQIYKGRVHPTIRGRAALTADSTLLLDSEDPFCFGIR